MNNYKYFENIECEFYPCHKKDFDGFNCLFCFCPLYFKEKCIGTPKYINADGKTVKDCSECALPHKKENYDAIIRLLSE